MLDLLHRLKIITVSLSAILFCLGGISAYAAPPDPMLKGLVVSPICYGSMPSSVT